MTRISEGHWDVFSEMTSLTQVLDEYGLYHGNLPRSRNRHEYDEPYAQTEDVKTRCHCDMYQFTMCLSSLLC